MSAPNEIKKDPKIQGTHILKSYLNALNIPYQLGEEPNALTVKTKRGESLTVSVGEGVATVTVDPTALASFELTKALGALHSVTEAAGYGRPMPVNRGETPTSRVNYNDNYEDVYLRHSIFRRSPNVTEAQLAPFMRVIKSAARRAMFRWRTVFTSMGFAEQDLVSIGMVHTTSFLHLYATSTNETDNIRLLTEFLNQRFGEHAKISHKKALNATCLPQAVKSDVMVGEDRESEASYIETCVETEESSPDEEYEEDSFTLTYPDGTEKQLRVENDGWLGLRMYLSNHLLTKTETNQLVEGVRSGKIAKRRNEPVSVPVDDSEETEKARREAAREELHRRLTEMSPERREVVLSYAALSRDYSPDARREARRLAEELACPNCKKKVPSGAVCISCDVQAVPRFGVDYMAFKEKLVAENHPMAEAMTAPIPDSEIRSRANRPVVDANAKPLALASTVSVLGVSPDEEPKKGKKKGETNELQLKIKAMSKTMADEFMKTLPEVIECPKCKRHLPKGEFGIRVARNKATGIPERPSRQSYCKPCRKP